MSFIIFRQTTKLVYSVPYINFEKHYLKLYLQQTTKYLIEWKDFLNQKILTEYNARFEYISQAIIFQSEEDIISFTMKWS